MKFRFLYALLLLFLSLSLALSRIRNTGNTLKRQSTKNSAKTPKIKLQNSAEHDEEENEEKEEENEEEKEFQKNNQEKEIENLKKEEQQHKEEEHKNEEHHKNEEETKVYEKEIDERENKKENLEEEDEDESIDVEKEENHGQHKNIHKANEDENQFHKEEAHENHMKSKKELMQEQMNNQIENNLLNEQLEAIVQQEWGYETSLSYYLPYLYKSNLITFPDSITDWSKYSMDCQDNHCNYCTPAALDLCEYCFTGYFLNGPECSELCPMGSLADVLRGKCVPWKEDKYEEPAIPLQQIIYTQAYSTGSCVNKCGSFQSDCSCSLSCKQVGNCCSDFEAAKCSLLSDDAPKSNSNSQENEKLNSFTNDQAEYSSSSSSSSYSNQNITPSSTSQCEDQNCFLCNTNSQNEERCYRCKDKYYLQEGKCVSSCGDKFWSDTTNHTCHKGIKCKLDNCRYCNNTKDDKCKRCEKGWFLNDGICIKSCPDKMIADRISWSCLSPPIFAWYWIHPSKRSCKSNCNKSLTDLKGACSCNKDCFKNATCCQDIDKYCPNLLFWKKSKRVQLSAQKLKRKSIK